METLLITLLVTLGGTGGVVALVKAINDYREKKSSREDGADDRLVFRLEARLNAYEIRISKLEQNATYAELYINTLIRELAINSLPIPERKITSHT